MGAADPRLTVQRRQSERRTRDDHQPGLRTALSPPRATACQTDHVPALILQILPFALGAAISPTVLTLEVFILASARQPKARAWAYALGGAVFTVLFMFLVFALLGAPRAGSSPSAVEKWVAGIAGVLLLLLGIRQSFPKRTAGEKRSSRVRERLENASYWWFVPVGFLMMLTDFSSLIILIPGIHHIVLANAAFGWSAAAAAILYVAVLLPMVIPVGLLTVMGTKADPLLAKLNTFCTKHARIIMAIICYVLAAYLAWTVIS